MGNMLLDEIKDKIVIDYTEYKRLMAVIPRE